MKKLFTILALITAVIALVLAVLPLSNLAFIPAIAALIFGIIAFIKSKSDKSSIRLIQLAFLLTIIALALATYKSIYSTKEIGNTEQLEAREKASEEEAIDELDDIIIED